MNASERPQDRRDLERLLDRLAALPVPRPEQQAIRDTLVAKLTRVAQAPWTIRRGYRPG
jgi:hypothetical protein